MLSVLTVEETRQAEIESDQSGHTYEMMMDSAGRAIAERCSILLNSRTQPLISILIGKGNNGGDGLVAAHYLKQYLPEAEITLICLYNRADDPLLQRVSHTCNIIDMEEQQGFEQIKETILHTNIIIDALFGIGIQLPLRDHAVNLLQQIHSALGIRMSKQSSTIYPLIKTSETLTTTKPLIVAVDCPSGVDCDTGEVDKHTLIADETITFIGAKSGLFEFPAAHYVGNITVATIDVPTDIDTLQSAHHHVIDHSTCKTLLPLRENDSHKGTYGKLLAIVGSGNYRGAAGLASIAAYRTGAGLVTVASTGKVVDTLSSAFPELTWLSLPEHVGSISVQAIQQLRNEIQNYTTIVLGCGFGQTQETQHLIPEILTICKENDLPIIIDADALNTLATISNWWNLLPSKSIITPHPGEMSRLSQASTGQIQTNRRAIAVNSAKTWSTTIVLKGAHTIIANSNGKSVISPFKTDALAKAGSGDVLAGIIGGLLAQGLDTQSAAYVGVYLHGLTGVLASETIASTRSVVATDLINHIGNAFSILEN